MSIPPDDPARGCAANFPQPVTDADLRAARNMVENVHRVNIIEYGLDDIVYRRSGNNYDIRYPLRRWETSRYDQIFEHGFQTRPQGNTPDNTYYDLERYVNRGGAPLSPRRQTVFAFVGTTLNDWLPPNPTTEVLPSGTYTQFYVYEIYAPGGIWVRATLRERYQDRHRYQAEVCFIGGIAPQFIRSCLTYTATRPAGSQTTVEYRRGDALILNSRFNPQAYSYIELVIVYPTHTYRDENYDEKDLPEETYPPNTHTEKRQVLNENSDSAHEWYTHGVLELPIYISAAFRSTRTDEAYIFMKREYALLNYAPHTTDDKILIGPLRISHGFPSLFDTAFGEHGIDCAFDTDYDTGFPFYTSKTEAFIFSSILCAYIDYAPGTTNDKILSGPMTIATMFPFFKGTVFENGIDAAFRSTRSREAYLFSGNKCALINYDSKNLVKPICDISDEFACLLGTYFADGIDAAFASHREGEAYLFKENLYTLIHFAPGTADDYMIGGRVKPILPNWPSLQSILPRKNVGCVLQDDYLFAQPNPDEHDEL